MIEVHYNLMYSNLVLKSKLDYIVMSTPGSPPRTPPQPIRVRVLDRGLMPTCVELNNTPIYNTPPQRYTSTDHFTISPEQSLFRPYQKGS